MASRARILWNSKSADPRVLGGDGPSPGADSDGRRRIYPFLPCLARALLPEFGDESEL